MKKDYAAEIAFYKDWCYTCSYYLISNFAPPEFREQLISSVEQIKLLQIPNTQAGLQSVKEGYYDILRETNNIPKDKLLELNEALFKKYGKDLNSESLKHKIETITRSQKIKNDTEYRIIEEAVIELSQTDPLSKKISLYNNLLSSYIKKD